MAKQEEKKIGGDGQPILKGIIEAKDKLQQLAETCRVHNDNTVSPAYNRGDIVVLLKQEEKFKVYQREFITLKLQSQINQEKLFSEYSSVINTPVEPSFESFDLLAVKVFY